MSAFPEDIYTEPSNLDGQTLANLDLTDVLPHRPNPFQRRPSRTSRASLVVCLPALC